VLKCITRDLGRSNLLANLVTGLTSRHDYTYITSSLLREVITARSLR